MLNKLKDHRNKFIWILCIVCIAIAVILIIADGIAHKMKDKDPEVQSIVEASSFSMPVSYADESDVESYSSTPSVSEAPKSEAESSVSENTESLHRAMPYLDTEQTSESSSSSSDGNIGTRVGTYSFPDSTHTGGDTRTNIAIDGYEGSYDLLSTYNDANADAMKQQAINLIAEKTPVDKISSLYYVNVPSGRYVFAVCGNIIYGYHISGENGNYQFQEIPNVTEADYDNVLDEAVGNGADE